MSAFDVKVLGPGCKRCETVAQMMRDAVADAGVDGSVEKVTDMMEIAKFGIAATPGIVVNGKVVHAGGLPKPEDIAGWLK